MSASRRLEHRSRVARNGRTQLRSPCGMGGSTVRTRRRTCAIPIICVCDQQTTSGSALTIYAWIHVGRSQAGHLRELTWFPHTARKSNTRMVAEADYLPAVFFFHGSLQMSISCLNTSGLVSVGKQTTKTTSLSSSPSLKVCNLRIPCEPSSKWSAGLGRIC